MAFSKPEAFTLRSVEENVESFINQGGLVDDRVQARPRDFIHRFNMADLADIELFTGDKKFGRMSLPKAQQLQDGQAFLLEACGFRILQGYDVDGTAIPNAEPFSASSHNAAIVAADKTAAIEWGFANLTINDESFLDEAPLDTLPIGGGPSGGVGLYNSNTAQMGAAGYVSNGVPSNLAMNRSPVTRVIWAGDPIAGKIRWPMSRTLTYALVGEFRMRGVLFSARTKG